MRTVLLTAVAAFAISAPAAAQLVTYEDRDAFNAASGPTEIEDFNDFTEQVQFDLTPFDFGPFTFAEYGNPTQVNNSIDIPPPRAVAFDIDGTTFIDAEVDGPSGFELVFDSPIFAFGADFSGFNNVQFRSGIEVDGVYLQPPIVEAAGTNSFFGFTSTTGFTTIRFVDLPGGVQDNFGMDNVTYGVSPTGVIPEPASWAMMIAGFGLVGGAMRRRERRLAIA